MKNNFQRRSFLKLGLTLGASSLMAPNYANAHFLETEEDFKFTVGPYLQTNFNNSITVLWLTNKLGTGWVEYGEEPTNLNYKAYSNSEMGLRGAYRTRNVVTINNLKPGSKYYYRIISKEIRNFQPYNLEYGTLITGGMETFVNVDPHIPEVSFVMLNDLHDRPESIPHLLNLVPEQKKHFVFFNGDVFDHQADEKQLIDNMLLPCVNSFAKNTPFIYVRGNHETRGKFAREFPEYFMQVNYSAFSLGPVRFVILDTGEDKEDAHPVYAGIVNFDEYRLHQAAWLKNEIESKAFKKASFRIVLMHIPPRFSGEAHGPKHCTTLFDPLLNRGRVDLVLSGHTHRYKVHQPDLNANHYPLIIGGGPANGKRTITAIKVTKQELAVTMLDDAGREVGSYKAFRK